jgi:hypothetical protein
MRSEIYSEPRKRAIQYSEASMVESTGRGVLDAPLEPVIGLAEGETRWRSMTVSARNGLSAVRRDDVLRCLSLSCRMALIFAFNDTDD